ncbi:MAG: antibiotic biosynthesis monooxygenase [Proteobacteria bacterium]|nr:antibiotic biosynthesis monooxygenase [Pseudomonadota bacterium]
MELIARFHARPGAAEGVEQAIRTVSGPTRAEPGCLDYHVFRATRDRLLLYIHSRWRDEAAFDAHAALPHTVRFLARVAPLIDHPLDVTRTTMML